MLSSGKNSGANFGLFPIIIRIREVRVLFIGQYSHNVDAKGRVSMPSKFRENTEGETFFVTKGTEKCLFVYSSSEWAKFADNLAKLPITTNPQAGKFARFFLSGAVECEVDKLGRINIPQYLREYAGIEKDVRVIGVRSRAEIWDAKTWDEYQNNDINIGEVLENMNAIGMDF